MDVPLLARVEVKKPTNPESHWLLHGFYFTALNCHLRLPFVVCFEMDPLWLSDCKAAQKAGTHTNGSFLTAGPRSCSDVSVMTLAFPKPGIGQADTCQFMQLVQIPGLVFLERNCKRQLLRCWSSATTSKADKPGGNAEGSGKKSESFCN